MGIVDDLAELPQIRVVDRAQLETLAKHCRGARRARRGRS
jgi:hypothetical protein